MSIWREGYREILGLNLLCMQVVADSLTFQYVQLITLYSESGLQKNWLPVANGK